MAAFDLILSQARRYCFKRSPSQYYPFLRSHLFLSPSFPAIYRSLCSLPSSPEPNAESQLGQPRRKPQSVPIQPVSYPTKPKDPSVPPQDEPSQFTAPPQSRRLPREAGTGDPRSVNQEARAWTREDIRYMKDAPTISPVSYPTRVAPLPEDRVEAKEELAEKEEKEKVRVDEQFEKERREIEADYRMMRRAFRVEEEPAPFPTLIKVENKKQKKVIYDLKDAIQLVKANAKRNFVETVEAHVKMTAELRRSDLSLKGSVLLPHDVGKTFRVAVFAEGASADEARAAGADIVGGQELIEGIKNGNVKVNFDKCVATHDFVPQLKKIAKVLKHLLPDPKKGTVSNDITTVLREAKQKLEFKKDKTAIVHVGLGKVNLSDEALRENVGAFVNSLLLAKPAGLKKSSRYAGYVDSFHICSTMGPSFPVSIQSLSVAADQYSRLQPR